MGFGITFGVDFSWEEQPPDGSVCYGCKDQIYGRMFVMCFDAGRGPVETSKKLCEPCYELMNENNNPLP